MMHLSRHGSQQGFTLIEVIIAMAVFSIAMTMAVTLFVFFIQQQRRTVVQQELQNDSRAVIEQIAQDLREGQADYSYYEANFAGDYHLLEDALDGTGTHFLVVRTTLNEEVRYRRNGAVLERCVVGAGATCTAAGSGWAAISPGTLVVESFSFQIRPTENPFDSRSPVECTSLVAPNGPSDTLCSSRWGTRCSLQSGTANYCAPQMFGDVMPLHPTVTFSLKVRRTAGNLAVSQTFQTTVASRQFVNLDKLNSYVP